MLPLRSRYHAHAEANRAHDATSIRRKDRKSIEKILLLFPLRQHQPPNATRPPRTRHHFNSSLNRGVEYSETTAGVVLVSRKDLLHSLPLLHSRVWARTAFSQANRLMMLKMLVIFIVKMIPSMAMSLHICHPQSMMSRLSRECTGSWISELFQVFTLCRLPF